MVCMCVFVGDGGEGLCVWFVCVCDKVCMCVFVGDGVRVWTCVCAILYGC